MSERLGVLSQRVARRIRRDCRLQTYINVDEDSDDGESDVVASGEHDEPDDEAGWDERPNTRDELECPRERQAIVVRVVTRHPEVFTL